MKTIAALASLLCLTALMPHAVEAAETAGTAVSRGDMVPGVPDAGQENPGGVRAPAGTLAKDGVPPRGDGNPEGPRPSGPPEGPPRTGGSDGLPDAVTVIDILRHLPQWPPRHGGTGTGVDGIEPSGPPHRVPFPKGKSRDGAPPLPPRVLTIAPDKPFVPKPVARDAGGALAITGVAAQQSRDREVLVALGSGVDAAAIYQISQDLGVEVQAVYASPLLGQRIVRLRIPDTRSVSDVVRQLSSDARIEVAEPHYVYTASAEQVSPAALPVPQYAPAKLHLGDAHKIASGKRVKIAVIDSQVDATHPALKGSITETFDVLGETRPEPELHGTAIAGIAAARAGLEGVAPAASVIAIRAFSGGANGAAQSYSFAIIKALDLAFSSGARVVNMSFAGPPDPLLANAIEAASAQGLVLVAAAGNGGPSAPPAYPGALPQVIAVSATDSSDALYKDANRGGYIAIAAPGVDIIAPAPKGAYDISSGTSLAAAHVSGIAALMLEKNPKLTGKDVRAALAASAHKLDSPADQSGAGLADAEAALKSLN